MRTGMGCNAVTNAIEDDHPPLERDAYGSPQTRAEGLPEPQHVPS
jgi:hypothetical protein